MSTLNPESASFDFVPPAARQQHPSPTLHDNSSNSVPAHDGASEQQQHAQYNHHAGTNGTPVAASKIPRSSSSHAVDPSASAATTSHKFAAPGASSSNQQEHSRERTTSSTSSSRGRGTSSQRARGTSSRGRGGSRSGHGTSEDGHTRGHSKSSSTSGIPVKKGAHAAASPPAPKPQPPVSLDSVDEFPALGGGTHSSSTSPSIPTSASFSTWSGPSLASIARRGSEQDPKVAENGSSAADAEHSSTASTSPTFSKSMTMPNLAASDGKKTLSFARVVAPTPPPASSSSANASSTPTSAGASSASPQTHASPTMPTHTPRSASASSASVSASSTPASSIHSANQALAATNAAMQPRAAEAGSAPHMVKAGSAQSSSNAPAGSSANGEQAESASMKKQTSKNGDAASANTASAAGGSKKKKKRSSKDQQNAAAGPNGEGMDYQQQPPYPYYEGQPYSNDYNQRDPFDVVHPDHTERPYFEPKQWQQQGQDAPPGVGLTPLQLAFLAANGLSVEGMPNVPDDVNVPTAEAMQSYYDYQQQQLLAERPQKGAGGGPGKKDGQKKGGNKRGQAGHPAGEPYQGANNGVQGFQSAQYPGLPYQQPEFDPGYTADHSQQEGPSGTAAESQQQQPPQYSPNSAFHFSAAAPTFTPHFLNTRAKTFKPKSPVLNSDAPIFEPHTSDQQASTSNEPKTEETTTHEQVSPVGNQQQDAENGEPQRKGEVEETPSLAAESQPQAANETDEQPRPVEAQSAPADAIGEAEVNQDQSVSDAGQLEAAPEAAETNEEAAVSEQPQSPPHSTFSLLPPVTVDDVLDKAKSMADTVVETAQEAADTVVASAKDATAAVSKKLEQISGVASNEERNSRDADIVGDEVAHEHTKANLDELAIHSDVDLAKASEDAVNEPSKEHPNEDAAANLDELDLPGLSSQDDGQRHSKESTGSTLSEATTTQDFSVHSLSPSEVEENLANANSSLAGNTALAKEMADFASKASFSKQPTFEIVSTSDLRCTPSSATSDAVLDEPSARPNDSQGSQPFEIVSVSDDQCVVISSEDAGSQASIEDTQSRFVRSSAPSPPSVSSDIPAENNEKPTRAPLSISTPPVVISPSTPVSPSTPGLAMFMNAQPESGSLSQTQLSSQPPQLVRHASEAEKQEAIRLVNELRSEPNTLMVESDGFGDDYTSASPANGQATADPDSDAPADFKFDLSGRFSELNSSKRKRGKADDDDDKDDDGDKRRKEDKKDHTNEAPSLTMAIFSGNLLPRKQLILSIFTSLSINLCLPFINGVMLGFGEIFARDWLGPLVGLVSRNRSTDTASSTTAFSSSGLGLRSAGASKRGGAQDVPGHAAAKTAVEAVTEKVVESASIT